MVVTEGAISNIMGGIDSTAGVRLHSHRHKLKQRFDILKKLGQGTYGKVQLAINKENGKEVAIKTIKKGKIETEQDLVRIRREIQIMSSVQHPQIIHIFEVFENREKMVLVMEYAAGGELYDYLSERKVLPEDEARRVFRQVASSVYYCHKHKICHRDLKLENILLDLEGNAKIADFGLSNVFDDKNRLDTFCGSPLYASPEIVKGIPYLGPEVDCWSLGVLLYTLVYGAMPFDGSNFRRLVKQITQGDFFEPATRSSASELIRYMLMVKASERATIEDICNHWWVNEGFKTNCLKEAEFIANQTPVRLDLLLSLAPKQIDSEHMLIQPDEFTEAVNLESRERQYPNESFHKSQLSTGTAEGTDTTRSHSAGAMPATTSGSMDCLMKKKIREKAVKGDINDSVTCEKKKKKKESLKKGISKKVDEKKKLADTNTKCEDKDTEIIEALETPAMLKKKCEEKVTKEKKKTKKKDSGEAKTGKKNLKKKENHTVTTSKASNEVLQSEIVKNDKQEIVANRLSSPRGKTAHEEQEQLNEIVKRVIKEPIKEEIKSPLEDSIDTDKILLETAAKIKSVEEALEAERISTSPKKTKSKPESLLESPASNKSSTLSSLVTSPTRSRTGSESSGDKTSSRRQSKIFSKAAMFDNLAAQNNSKSPPLVAQKRTPKPGPLNITDLTKKFEEKPISEKKSKIITPVKVSDAKRAFEHRSEISQKENKAASKRSDSQPSSPSVKLSSLESVSLLDVTLVKFGKEAAENAVVATQSKPGTQEVSTKPKELSGKNELNELHIPCKLKETIQPNRQIRTKISPSTKGGIQSRMSEDTPVARQNKFPETITDANISTTNIPPKKISPRIRQVEITLESSDSSDSESEAEKMLRDLTEKREKLEQAKSEKLRKVIEARDRDLLGDMTAIKEEPHTPTPARHVAPSKAILLDEVKSFTLPRDYKAKEAESSIGKKSLPLSAASSHGDNTRKKAHIQITLSSSKPNLRASDSCKSQSSSRDSLDYRTESTQKALGDPTFIPAISTSMERVEPHLQRGHRERIIPIMLEDEDNSYQEGSVSTSSVSTVPMYCGNAIVSSMPQEMQKLSREPIQKSRRERIIPITVEDEGILTPPLSDAIEGNVRRPTMHQFNQKFGLGKNIIDRSDSFSSAGEDDDDDDDGFQILTAESLFSTLLSRVRSLTRKMADDTRSMGRNNDGRLADVDQPGAFWSSLYTSDFPARRMQDNVCRENTFGLWNRSLSREPSDADSDISEQSSLTRGWRNRRSGVQACQLSNPEQTNRRVSYSRTMSRDFPKHNDCRGVRVKISGKVATIPLPPSNLASPIPKVRTCNMDKNTTTYAKWRNLADKGYRRPHSTVGSLDVSGKTVNWLDRHGTLPNIASSKNHMAPIERNKRINVEKVDIPYSDAISNIDLSTTDKLDKREGYSYYEKARKPAVIAPEAVVIKEGNDVNSSADIATDIPTELVHLNQDYITQIERKDMVLPLTEKTVNINTVDDANIKKVMAASRISGPPSLQSYLAVKGKERSNCSLDCMESAEANKYRKESKYYSPNIVVSSEPARIDICREQDGTNNVDKYAKQRGDITAYINAKIPDVATSTLKKISPLERYRKSKSNDLSIPINIISYDEISPERFERSKSPFEKAKSSIKKKLQIESASITQGTMNKTMKHTQQCEERDSNLSPSNPTLTLNASEIWPNNQPSQENPVDVDRSKLRYRIFSPRIKRSLSSITNEQINDVKNKEKSLKDDKFRLIRPARFLRGKPEKSSLSASLVDPNVQKINLPTYERKSSKRLSDALNRLLGRRVEENSEQRPTTSKPKDVKMKENLDANENEQLDPEINEQLCITSSTIAPIEDSDNASTIKKTDAYFDNTITANSQHSKSVPQIFSDLQIQLAKNRNSDVSEQDIVNNASHNIIINNDDESVMDRINRKSYYSRFNESKRKLKGNSIIDFRVNMDEQLAVAKARLLIDEKALKGLQTNYSNTPPELLNPLCHSSALPEIDKNPSSPRTTSLSPQEKLYHYCESPANEIFSSNVVNSSIPPEKLSFYRQPRLGVNEKSYFRVAVRPSRDEVTNRLSVPDVGRIIVNNEEHNCYKTLNNTKHIDKSNLLTEISPYSTLSRKHNILEANIIPVKKSCNIFTNNLIAKMNENQSRSPTLDANKMNVNSGAVNDKYIMDSHWQMRNGICTNETVDQLMSKQNRLYEMDNFNPNLNIPNASPNIAAPTSVVAPRKVEYRRTKTTPRLTDNNVEYNEVQASIERLPYRRTTTNVHLPFPQRSGDFRWILKSQSNRSMNRTAENVVDKEK